MSRANPSRVFKNNEINFRKDIANNLLKSNSDKVAVLVSNEYEGLSRNGGIGTYYSALGKKLKEAQWTTVLIYCQSDGKFQGKSDVADLDFIFSTGEIFDSLILQSSQLLILDQAGNSESPIWQSLSCLFYIQSVIKVFNNAQIYIEFHDINGFGYHTCQAKQIGLLPDNCLTSLTIHGCFEWIFEAGEAMINDDWFWQALFREQESYEGADLTFFPSSYLKSKVESYGWNNPNAIHMPYFIPFSVGEKS